MAFVFSVILVKPQIVSLSPHYSCCFIIAFIAMLMMPYLLRKRCIPRILIFLELGIITMFFDFYTTPIITFGFPFLYLYLLEQREGTYIGIRELLGMLIAWVAGYLLMWLSKLILTSIFTNINSFANALEAVKIWLVIGRGNVDSSGGNMLSYLMGVAYGFYQYTKWLALLLVFFAVFAAVYVYWVKKNRVSLGWLKKNKMLLIIAAVPLVWFVITSKPSFFHNGYQYRNIALFFFALGSYLAGAVKDKKATYLNYFTTNF